MHVVWHGVSSVAFLYMYQPSVKSTHPSDGYWHGPARIEGKLPNRLPKPRNNDPKLSLLVGSEVAGCDSTTALGSTITVRTSIFRNCIIISGLSVVIPILYVPYDYFDTLFNSVTAIFPQSTHAHTTCFTFNLSRLHSKQSGVVKGVIQSVEWITACVEKTKLVQSSRRTREDFIFKDRYSYLWLSQYRIDCHLSIKLINNLHCT